MARTYKICKAAARRKRSPRNSPVRSRNSVSPVMSESEAPMEKDRPESELGIRDDSPVLADCLQKVADQFAVKSSASTPKQFRDQRSRSPARSQPARVAPDTTVQRSIVPVKSSLMSAMLSAEQMDLDTAIETIRTDIPTNYAGEFIQKRDLELLLAFRGL